MMLKKNYITLDLFYFFMLRLLLYIEVEANWQQRVILSLIFRFFVVFMCSGVEVCFAFPIESSSSTGNISSTIEENFGRGGGIVAGFLLTIYSVSRGRGVNSYLLNSGAVAGVSLLAFFVNSYDTVVPTNNLNLLNRIQEEMGSAGTTIENQVRNDLISESLRAEIRNRDLSSFITQASSEPIEQLNSRIEHLLRSADGSSLTTLRETRYMLDIQRADAYNNVIEAEQLMSTNNQQLSVEEREARLINLIHHRSSYTMYDSVLGQLDASIQERARGFVVIGELAFLNEQHHRRD